VKRVLLLLVLGALLAPVMGVAQIYDARSMGMAGVEIPRPRGDVARVNPAYRAVPPVEVGQGRSIPLPIGLLGRIGNVPSFDVDDDDFDLVELADFLWNFPWALQIGGPDAARGDIFVDITRDAITVDLGAARDRVPLEGFDAGDYRTLFDWGNGFALGPRYGHVYVGWLQGWEVDEIDVDLDDALVGVLRDLEPIVGGRTYALRGVGRGQIGVSSSLAYVREIPLPGIGRAGGDWLDQYWDTETRRPRWWVGVGARRYLGLATLALDGDLALTGQEPLLADTSTFDLESATEIVRATPRGLKGWGTGWALDLGTVVRWQDLEFGAGIADLFADLHWGNGRIDEIVYDDVTDDFVQETIDGSTRISTSIPRSWRVNALWRRDALTLLAAELSAGPGGRSYHLGAERWVRGDLVLRAGVERDRREQWQAGAGVGVRRGPVGFDVGLRTHSRNVRGARMAELGVSLVLGGVR
jgi:hypothetical protein